MTTYDLLQFVHVLMAIIAVGFNASYGVWLSRAAREPGQLPYVLATIKFLDDRIANPAYVLLLITGVVMVIVEDLGFETLWISAGIALYVVVVLVAVLGYSPALRRQLALAAGGDTGSAEYEAVSRRATVSGIVTAVLVVAIVFFMVTKPT